MSTTTKSRPSRARLAAERDEANLARLRAEGHLEVLLREQQLSEAEADALTKAGFDPALAPSPEQAQVRQGRSVRYHRPVAVERLAAAEADAREAQAAYDAAVEAFNAAPPDPEPEQECRRVKARYYAGRTLRLGEAVFYGGEPVPNRELAGLEGRKLAALVKARHLIDAAPFAALEVNP